MNNTVSVFDQKIERWVQLTPEQSIKESFDRNTDMCFPAKEWDGKKKDYEKCLEKFGYFCTSRDIKGTYVKTGLVHWVHPVNYK